MKIRQAQLDGFLMHADDAFIEFVVDHIRSRAPGVLPPSEVVVREEVARARSQGARTPKEILVRVALAVRPTALGSAAPTPRPGEARVAVATSIARAASAAVQSSTRESCAEYHRDFFEIALPVIRADDGSGNRVYPPVDGIVMLSSCGGYARSLRLSQAVTTNDNYCSLRFYGIESKWRDDVFTAVLSWDDGVEVLFRNSRIYSFIEHAIGLDRYQCVVDRDAKPIRITSEKEPPAPPLQEDHTSTGSSNGREGLDRRLTPARMIWSGQR